jgi:hypothetical protein
MNGTSGSSDSPGNDHIEGQQVRVLVVDEDPTMRKRSSTISRDIILTPSPRLGDRT